MKGNGNKNTESMNDAIRMELKYCERCGGLWLRECGVGVVYCGNCQAEVAELPVPKKKPGRVKIPVRPHALVEEYGFSSRSVKLEHNDAEYSDHEHSDDDGGLDFDAAGGAA
jgi:hypothetical protein